MVAASPQPPPKPKDLTRVESDEDILEFSELPAAVQRALPKLAVTGYVNYAGDPPGRMVALGDQLVREGEEVRAGLKLEQIRPNEAIFSYKGYRFRLKAP
jgi:general secretion pathway protein B